jgi:hypothetical protein
LFETAETFGVTMAYVKDEGNNLSTMTNALTFVIILQIIMVDNNIYRELLGACNVSIVANVY